MGESGKSDKERMEHGEAQWEDELCGAAAQTRQPTACRLLGTNLETALLLACPHSNRSDEGPEHRGTLRERCSGIGDLDGGMDY